MLWPAFDKMKLRFAELEQLLGDPAIINDRAKYTALAKEHGALSKRLKPYDEYLKVAADLANAETIVADANQDPEMKALAEEEVVGLKPRLAALHERLEDVLLGSEENFDSIIVEIRAGTGGDEATLFVAEVFRMYNRYAEMQKWKVEVLSTSESGVGGLKEVIALIEGERVYSRLKYESGVHRVQRVPATEQQGRVHTSAITVAVLPEAEDVDVKIEAKDLRIDTFCSSGPGGQSVNTTYSAVRITHLPTNTVVSCQDEKSQIKNRDKAMRVLRSRLYEVEMQKQQDALAKERKQMVGSGDRSEKIRTYNFPQNRLTDHRIGFTIHQLEQVMDGKIQPLIDALISHYQAEDLKRDNAAGAATA
jgi:peptide chain release factor 1